MKLVSIVTPSFWPGLRALAHSLKFKGDIMGLDWIIMTEKGDIPDEWYEWLARCGFNLISKPYFDIKTDKWPKEFPATQARFMANWHKLRIWLLPPDEYIWLDTDLLCVNQSTDLLYTKSITAALEQADDPHDNLISTGLMRFDPSAEMFDECVDVMMGMKESVLADQTVLNAALARHPGMLHVLDYEWEMMWSLSLRKPSMWRPEKAKFIHFSWAVKPWMNAQPLEVPRQWWGIWNKVMDIWRDYAEAI
jgi:hypothetical protein